MLSTIVHTQTSQEISYMHLIIKPHSGVKRNIKYGNDHHPHPLPCQKDYKIYNLYEKDKKVQD